MFFSSCPLPQGAVLLRPGRPPYHRLLHRLSHHRHPPGGPHLRGAHLHPAGEGPGADRGRGGHGGQGVPRRGAAVGRPGGAGHVRREAAGALDPREPRHLRRRAALRLRLADGQLAALAPRYERRTVATAGSGESGSGGAAGGLASMANGAEMTQALMEAVAQLRELRLDSHAGWFERLFLFHIKRIFLMCN